MDGFQGKRGSKDTRQAFEGTQIGQPVPREEAIDTDDQILPRGRNSLEQGVWPRGHMPGHQDLAILVQDAEVHGAGMQVNATIKCGLFGVEAPEVSSSFMRDSLPLSAYHRGRLRRGPQ